MRPSKRWIMIRLSFVLLCVSTISQVALAADPADRQLEAQFAATIGPFLKTYCQGCHGQEEPKGKLDLTPFSTVPRIAAAHSTWETVLERLEAGEMPPEGAPRQPKPQERQAVVAWIKSLRRREAERSAGDPGVVPVRRLSNAEYNYTIRDLTGVDIRP